MRSRLDRRQSLYFSRLQTHSRARLVAAFDDSRGGDPDRPLFARTHPSDPSLDAVRQTVRRLVICLFDLQDDRRRLITGTQAERLPHKARFRTATLEFYGELEP